MSTPQIQLSETSHRILCEIAEKTGQSLTDVLDKALDAYHHKLFEEDETVPTITLSPEAQLAFWRALHETPQLTEAQKRLGAMMRGEA